MHFVRSFRRRHRALLAVVAVLGLGCMALAVVFGNCATAPARKHNTVDDELDQKFYQIYKKHRGPTPESEWNAERLWYSVSDNPPTYLPRGYDRRRSRHPSAGTWFVDERDGKRLFVPKGGAGGIPEEVLRTEAHNATLAEP